MKRHVARMANTDQRVVVVFMQIPGKEDHSLVVATDNLPPRWEQLLMEILESPEGQGDENLGTVLGRRMMQDSQDTLLQSLHNAGLLVPVPVDNVIMYPLPNQPHPLRGILERLGRLAPKIDVETEKFNPHTSNQTAKTNEDAIGLANGLLIEAELLEQEARNKRERAYSYAPQLRAKHEVKQSTKKVEVVEVVAPATKTVAAKRLPKAKTAKA